MGEIVISPLRLPQTKSKSFILNLNVYRNTHYRILNNMKALYKKRMKSQIEKLGKYERIILVYTLYPKDKRKCDVANICSVHDKYYSDCLEELGIIPNDNYLHLPLVVYKFGEIDKEYPRVEIEIFSADDVTIEIKEKNNGINV